MEEFTFGENNKVVAEPDGQCIDFSFTNHFGPVDNKVSWVFEDHEVYIEMMPGKEPDLFYIIPATGWEIVTQNFLLVAESATAVITVCQQLLG